MARFKAGDKVKRIVGTGSFYGGSKDEGVEEGRVYTVLKSYSNSLRLVEYPDLTCDGNKFVLVTNNKFVLHDEVTIFNNDGTVLRHGAIVEISATGLIRVSENGGWYKPENVQLSGSKTADTQDAGINPKQKFGDKKPDLSLCPTSAAIKQAEAHMDGMLKYGRVNWRERSVEAMTYVKAAQRHLELFSAGEAVARDTGVSNLGAVMACCAILIDAELHGTMIDNRDKSPQTCDLLHEAEAMVAKLRELQKERENEG